MMLPVITTRQMEKYSGMLGLSPEQKEAADALFEGYAEQARNLQEQVRTKMEAVREEFRDTQDPTVFTKMRESMTEARDARKKLDEGFANDVKAVLTPEQTEKWPAVERAQRRELTLRRGFLSGERVDLVELTQEEVPEEARAAVAPVIEQYEVDMDRELVRRNEAYEKGFEKLGEMRQGGDMEGAQAVIEQGREAGARVRDLNRRYARQIAGMLPDEAKSQFELAFKRGSFPEVYRPSQASRQMAAATAFEDLTDTQKDGVASLNTAYQRSAEALNEKLAGVIEENEMKVTLETMFRRGEQEGPLADLRRERRDLDRTTTESLRKLLTPEQQERLPNPERGGDGAPGERRMRRGNGAPDPT